MVKKKEGKKNLPEKKIGDSFKVKRGKNPWNAIAIVVILVILIVVGFLIFKNVYYGPGVSFSSTSICPNSKLTQYYSADSDKDGVKDICPDTCLDVYNPNQNSKYCDPFYKIELRDDPDKDRIPNTPTYNPILKLYISEVASNQNVAKGIRTQLVETRTSLTAAPTTRIFTVLEITKLSLQGATSTPTPTASPTASASASPTPK